MKLLSFEPNDSRAPELGVLVRESCVASVPRLLNHYAIDARAGLTTIVDYLESRPASEALIAELWEKLGAESDPATLDGVFSADAIRLLPPVPHPPALFDFGLTPRHLRDAAIGLVNHEFRGPLRWALRKTVRFALDPRRSRKGSFKYYRSNHAAMIGDMESPVWPRVSSYLDIEPELGVVLGGIGRGVSQKEIEFGIAGYTIFNDFSLRDIQWPDMTGMAGPARCKDFDRSKGLGPYLVTPDEVGDPLSLGVSVRIGDRYRWQGHTREYAARPIEVLDHLVSTQTLWPGTIIGMGTIPGTCSVETDEWLLPGELVEITFEKLGTLRQQIPAWIPKLEKSRWSARPELLPYQEEASQVARRRGNCASRTAPLPSSNRERR